MSIPYGAAATLLFGEPKLEHFEAEARRDPELLGLVERVEVRVAEDPAIADPTRLAARVSLSIGERTYSVPVTEPKGDPANPVGDQLLEEKFLGLAAPVVGEEAAKHLATAIWNLDRQDTVSRDQGLRFMEYCRPEKKNNKKR
jgi:2-methylcitrate dehydratase PrpD